MLGQLPSAAVIEPLAPTTALLVLAAALGAAVMGVVVLVRERASRESLLYFVFSLAVAAWFLPFSLMYLGPDLEWSALWARAAYLGVPFIAPAAYQFGLAMARHPTPRGPMVVLWAIGAAFCLMAFTTDLLVAGIRLHPWGPYPEYGPAGPPFVGFVVVVILLLIRRLWYEARRTGEEVHRRRMRGMAAAFAVMGLGVVDFVPKFGGEVFPFGFAAFFGFLAVSGWIIYRYRLVDYTPSLAADDVLETMADALLVTDPKGRIRLTNRTAESWLGRGSEPLVGRTLGDLDSGRDAGTAESLADLQEKGEVIDLVLPVRTAGGGLREVSAATSPLTDDAGQALGWVILLRDVTERRALEARLLQAQKLEAVGRLAGGVAHDFNNFLTAMRDNARFVLDELREDTPARGEMLVLDETLTRASRLTRQLLAFGRKGMGEPEVFRLGSVAQGMEGMLRRIVGEGVDFDVRTSAAERPVEADRGQIEQVLLNLVVNAEEAMPDGGRIRVSVEPLVLRGAGASSEDPDLPEGAYTRLRVVDTGSGMTEATRSRIFEPFFSTKQRETGGGLGLATVYGIVTQAGGTVIVATEPGKGSTFDVYLPVAEAPTAETPADFGSGSAPKRGSGEAILVVEDDEAVRRVMRRALEAGGYRVLTAASATNALSLLDRAQEVSAVVTDALMSGMAGPEFLRVLRKRGVNAPAILVSGHTEAEIARHGEIPEGVAVMSKPFEAEELVRRVRMLLHLSSTRADEPAPLQV